jgi:hypothetical protein
MWDGGVDNYIIIYYMTDKSTDKKITDMLSPLDKLTDIEWKYFCKQHSKLPHILPKKERIVAIGDLHGDLDKTIKAFKLANLIDDQLNWIAIPKDTVVVQVGDQIDGCRPRDGMTCENNKLNSSGAAGDIKILRLLNLLHKKAEKHGGAVYSLLGNHEIMNVLGDVRYVSNKDLLYDEKIKDKGDVQSGIDNRKYYFKPGNKYAKLLACTRLSAIIIGSNLFVHAGVLPELAKKYNVQEMNNVIIIWLLGLLNDNKKGVADVGKIRGGDVLFWNRLIDFINKGDNKNKLLNMVNDIVGRNKKSRKNLSPFWPRILGKIKSDESNKEADQSDKDKAKIFCKTYLQPALQIYDVNNMIIGHTPQFLQNEDINSACNGKVWRVDVGISDAFDSFDKGGTHRNIQVLEIWNDVDFKPKKYKIP